jgi:hypothetical protein
VREPEGEVAVIGEQEQAGGVGIEPPYRVNAQPLLRQPSARQQGQHGGPALRVFHGGDDAQRLVQRDVDELLDLPPLGIRLEGLAIHRYRVHCGVGTHAHLLDHLAVDGDAARRYQLLGGAA